jgi:PmbA protein
VILAEGNDFSVTVRLGEVETLEQAGSKALGLRVFVAGAARSPTRRTSRQRRCGRWSPTPSPWLASPARMPPPACPRRRRPRRRWSWGCTTPRPPPVPTAERIEWARRTEAAALAFSKEIDNSSGASFSAGEDTVVLANSLGFVGSYRSSNVSFSVVPVAQRDGDMQRDYWYSAGRGMGDLLTPEEVGRIAGERTVRRLGSRQVATCEAPIVFDPGDRGRAPRPPLPRGLGLLGVPQRDVPQGPRGRAGGLAAAHDGRRGTAAARASARARSTARGCPRARTCRSRRAS